MKDWKMDIAIDNAASVRLVRVKRNWRGRTQLLVEHRILDDPPAKRWLAVGDTLSINFFFKNDWSGNLEKKR